MMLNTIGDLQNELALKALAVPVRAPFKAAPVLAPFPDDPQRELLRRTHWTAVASWLYINRVVGSDRFGPLPTGYMAKADDLVATGRRHPIDKFPMKYKSGRLIWDEADAAVAADPAHAAAIHIIGSLPNGVPAQWQRLVEQYLDRHFAKLGMVVDWAIHAQRDEQGGWATPPHFHGLVTARRFRDDIRKGERQDSWLYSKAQIVAAEDAWLAAMSMPMRAYI